MGGSGTRCQLTGGGRATHCCWGEFVSMFKSHFFTPLLHISSFPSWPPAQVKRRYLDWRALMKRKQLQAEISLSSSSSSVAMKTEYDQSSPEHEAASVGSEYEQLLDLSGFPKDCQCDWPELTVLGEPSGQALMAQPGVKMEDDVSEYRVRYPLLLSF